MGKFFATAISAGYEGRRASARWRDNDDVRRARSEPKLKVTFRHLRR